MAFRRSRVRSASAPPILSDYSSTDEDVPKAVPAYLLFNALAFAFAGKKCKRITITMSSVAQHRQRIYLPHQERSRITMDRILSTLGKLLESKPFDDITILELARRSRCAVTSIYARFEDKRALILALHERHRDEMIFELDRLLDPARREGVEMDEIVRSVLGKLIASRKRRHNLLRAAMLLNDPEVYERAAEIVRHASERLAKLLGPRLAHLDGREAARRVDFGVRAVTAIIQQREIFGEAEPARFRLNDGEFQSRLSKLFVSVLADDSSN